jgi:hypothetical protein
LIVVLDGVAIVAFFSIRDAAVVEGLGVFRVQVDRSIVVLDGPVEVPLLVPNVAAIGTTMYAPQLVPERLRLLTRIVPQLDKV